MYLSTMVVECCSHKYSTPAPHHASDVMLSNFRLGDHAESLFPRIITVAYQNRQFPASCTNASFHIVSPLCKSKCGNRIRLIL